MAGWERQEHAVGLGRGCGAGGEELVDEGLCAVAGNAGKRGFEVGVIDDERIWVGGKEEAEVEGVGGGFLDCDGEFFGGCCGSHGDVSECRYPFLNVYIIWYNDGIE